MFRIANIIIINQTKTNGALGFTSQDTFNLKLNL